MKQQLLASMSSALAAYVSLAADALLTRRCLATKALLIQKEGGEKLE
jgi:hypothetical protein